MQGVFGMQPLEFHVTCAEVCEFGCGISVQDGNVVGENS